MGKGFRSMIARVVMCCCMTRAGWLRRVAALFALWLRVAAWHCVAAVFPVARGCCMMLLRALLYGCVLLVICADEKRRNAARRLVKFTRHKSLQQLFQFVVCCNSGDKTKRQKEKDQEKIVVMNFTRSSPYSTTFDCCNLEDGKQKIGRQSGDYRQGNE